VVEFLFWLLTGVVLYTFFGYAGLIALLARCCPRPARCASIAPSVALLILAYNEEDVIAAKLENSLQLDYPRDLLKIIVVADGSDDATVAIAQRYAGQGVAVWHQPTRRGKVAAMNRAVPLLDSEIVVFTDANAMLNRGALRALVRHFADPQVAVVTGERRVTGGGEGLYWRYESYLRRCDDRFGSTMGAVGELFAIRRALYQPPSDDTIDEDFFLSMRLVAAGWRIAYEPEAVAVEEPNRFLADDWERRARISAGGFQAIARLPEMLDPRRGRVVWQYVSHRLLRWVSPLFLPLILLLSLALADRPFYRLVLGGQLAFYGAGVAGYWRARRGCRRGLLYVIFHFCMASLADIVGFWRLITGRQPVTWAKARRRG